MISSYVYNKYISIYGFLFPNEVQIPNFNRLLCIVSGESAGRVTIQTCVMLGSTWLYTGCC